MQRKKYSKHAILADKYEEKPSPTAMAQITNWFKQRDYSFTDKQGELEYARELEIRLHILQTLTFNQFYVSPATGGEMQYWKNSCLSGNACLTSLEYENNRPIGNLVTPEKPEYLLYRHELAKYFEEPLPTLGANAALDEIQTHSKQELLALKRREYLCPLQPNDRQVLLSINLAGGDDKTILKEVQNILSTLRKKLAIPEPAVEKLASNNESLSTYINKKALQYLDLLIYCIEPLMTNHERAALANNHSQFLRPAPRSIWDLTDAEIADLIGPHYLAGNNISKWRNATFEPKLLNSEFICASLLAVRTKENA